MKRATLTAYPTTPTASPADLTDRLLAGQAGQPAPAGAKERRQPPAAQRASRKPAAAGPEPSGTAVAPAASSLESALTAVETATEALRQASREAPARYDVALRFRLDALAHHLQQVREFVTSVTRR